MNNIVERLRDQGLVLQHPERKQIADLIEQQVERIKKLETELECERMRLAACGTAALGYFDGCKDEYRSASLDDVLRLREQLTTLRKRIDDAPVVAHAVMNGDRVIQLSVSCDPMYPHSAQLINKEDLK